ncbi:fungal hydrophobin [Trametes cingulata]|nr:fungal hydrophobin [Trametes cingulata]
MFSTLFTLSALTILAAATPAPAPDASCSTAPIQCCDSVELASSATAANLLKSIGVVIQDLNIPIGITCSPITGVGVGSGSSCSANTVCCEDNSHGGLLSIGCVPVVL